jgi:hypothetical protein
VRSVRYRLASKSQEIAMKNLVRTALLAGAVLCAVSAAKAQVSIGVLIGAPPPPRVVYVEPPPPPAPEFIWVQGYWYPVGSHYKWHEGYWTRPPYVGARWVAPHHDGHRYFAGYWEGDRGHVDHDHHWDHDHDRDFRHDDDDLGPGNGHGNAYGHDKDNR